MQSRTMPILASYALMTWHPGYYNMDHLWLLEMDGSFVGTHGPLKSNLVCLHLTNQLTQSLVTLLYIYKYTFWAKRHVHGIFFWLAKKNHKHKRKLMHISTWFLKDWPQYWVSLMSHDEEKHHDTLFRSHTLMKT